MNQLFTNMKRLKDLKEGDKIWVKCPSNSKEWHKEIVTKVTMGEDMHKGSGMWFMHIMTDKSKYSCSDENSLSYTYHWPILIKSIGNQCQEYVEASSNVKMIVSSTIPKEIDKKDSSLNDIINQSRIIDLSKQEPLPEVEAYIVGMGNDNWECRHFYSMKYGSDEKKHTYGGYQSYDKEGNLCAWWTMNWNYSNFRSEYMFVVPDYDTGKHLADLLRLIGNDWLDIESAINQREEEIIRIQKEIQTIKNIKDSLKKKVNIKQ